jgi:hypothetical protein
MIDAGSADQDSNPIVAFGQRLPPALRKRLPDRLGAWQWFQGMRYLGPLGIGIAFAKGPLSRAEIGVWESLLLLSGMTAFFWVGGLLGTLVPRYRKAGPLGRKALLAGSFWSAVLLNSILVAALALLGPDTIGPLLGQETLPAFGIFLGFVALNNPAFLAEYVYLLDERPRALIGYGLASTLTLWAAVLIPVFAGLGLSGALSGMFIHSVLRFAWLFGLLHRRLGGLLWRKPPRRLWQGHVRLASSLAGSLLLGGAGAYADGMIVIRHLGPDALALFQYGARELPMVYLLANAFSTAAAADVAARADEGLALIRSRSSAWTKRFLLVGIGLMWTSYWWYPLIFSASFQASHQVFNVYLLLIVPRLLFPQTVWTGLERNRPQLWVAGFELLLNIGLSLLLVPHFGLVGVAWATVFAHWADKLLLMLWLHREQGIAPQRYADLPWTMVSVVALLGAYGLSLLWF